MLLEGVQLYLMLVKILPLGRSQMPLYCMIAYGVPFIIVSISAIINTMLLSNNGYGTETQ